MEEKYKTIELFMCKKEVEYICDLLEKDSDNLEMNQINFNLKKEFEFLKDVFDIK